jgi:hypothetical protein
MSISGFLIPNPEIDISLELLHPWGMIDRDRRRLAGTKRWP